MAGSMTVRVYYEDTDATGVVYHANYLRWFERARTEWLRAHGFSQERLLRDAGIGFTLASISVRYLLPARLDDELRVITRVTFIGKASVRFEQEIQYDRSEAQRLAHASVRVGCVGIADFRPRRLPEALEQALSKEQGHDG